MSLTAKSKNINRVVGVVVKNNANYVEALFNLMSASNIVVPLRDDKDEYRIKAANINEIIEPKGSDQWLKKTSLLKASNDTALITFTSGTEGEPKGVLLSNKNLTDTVDRLLEVMDIDSTICEYIGIPVYLSFGFGRCRLISSVDGQGYIPADGFNPFELTALIDSDGINAISAVPSLFRVLLKNADLFKENGEKIKWIEIGSQYMSAEEKKHLKTIFPKAKIIQHYGLTEASRTTFLDISTVDDEYLESVGKAYGQVKFRINGDGKIEIKGPHVAQSYLQNKESVSLLNSEGWFETSDLGEEKNGFLFYKGRADDVINSGGLKIAPEQIERELISQIENPVELALSRRIDKDLGEGFLLSLKYGLDIDTDKYYAALIKALKKISGINAANSIALVIVKELPKTASGKIQRKLLEETYNDVPIYKLKNTAKKNNIKLNSDQQKILDLCTNVFNLGFINIDESFYDLGINSLTFIELIAKIKKDYNKDLSVNDVFKNPTVTKLTELIFSNDNNLITQDHAVDVIRNGDDSAPFFFVGSPVYGNHLCKRLTSKKSMYALNIFGLEELYKNKLRTFTIYDIAGYFYKEIKRIQKNGPYYLGAYCADENVAMEVARHIINDGDTIKFFGFFDVTASFTERQSILLRFKNKIKNVGPSYFVLFIKRKIAKIIEKIQDALWKIKFKKTDKIDPNESVLGRDRLVVDRFWDANREYKPEPLAVHITAYRSKEWSSDPLDILASSVKSYEEIVVPGTHTGMFLDEGSLAVLVESVDKKLG